MTARFALLITTALLLPAAAPAQRLDLTQKYNVLANKDVDRLETDLNKAGQEGYRVIAGSTTGGDEVTLLLEKVGGGPYEYIVIAAGDPKKVEQRLSLSASQGFRLLPNTLTSKSKLFGSDDIVVVLEKVPNQQGNWQYLLADTVFGSGLQVTLSGATSQGYAVLGMLRKKDQVVLVLGKPAA